MAQVSVSFGAAFSVWLGVQAHLEVWLGRPRKRFPLKKLAWNPENGGPPLGRGDLFFFLETIRCSFSGVFCCSVIFADTVDSTEIQLTMILSMVRALEHHTKQGSPDF